MTVSSTANRARARRWLAIALTSFLLRSLIPIGFMPAVGPGPRIGLMLCDGYAPTGMHMSADMDMDMSMNMPASVPAPHHTGSQPNHSACPYGASPTLAALPASFDVLGTVQPPASPLPAMPQITFSETILRSQSPRGPPPTI